MPPKCLLLVLYSLAAAVTAAHAQKLVWKERAPLPLPRSGYMAGAISGKYVVAGGSYWVGNQKHWSTQVDVFDPADNTWSKAAPLPEPRSDAASAVYDGTLYIFGGDTAGQFRRDALEFRKGKWNSLVAAELPDSRVYSFAVVCKGMIYLVGGMARSGDYSSASNSFWRWNPKSPHRGWNVLPTLPGPGLIDYAMAAANGKIYVLGGAIQGGRNVVNVRTVFEFDPSTNKWTRHKDLPVARRCWWGLGLSNKILLLGGYTDTFEREVLAYELPSGNVVNAGSMPHGICAAEFVRVGNSIIGSGGEVAPKVRGRWTLEAPLP